MSKKTWIIGGVAVLAIAGATILGRSLNHANDSKGSTGTNKVTTLKVAHTQNYVPYDFVDEKGESDGYEVAVLKAIDEKLPDYKFEYTGTSDDDLLIGLESGKYDSVATRRKNREGEPPIRSWCARKFYQLINKISDADIVDGARDFRLMKREMVSAIVSMGEYNRFSKGIFGWIGYKTYWLSYKNVERAGGKTKWNFWKLFKYAIDGIINFSEVPLSIASWSGIGMTFIAFIMMLVIIIKRVCFGDPVAGWASTMCVILFIEAIQLFSIGIMGQYIAKSYNETKHRPHYIVSESNKETVKKIN